MDDLDRRQRAVNVLGQEYVYLYYDYIDNPHEYNLPPHSSIIDCAWKTMTTHNIDTGNAYTMLILAVIAVYKLSHTKHILLKLFLYGLFVHSIVALLFHATKSYNKQTAIKWARNDAICIFIAQLFIFIAYGAALPWTVTCIMNAAYMALVYIVIEQITNLPETEFPEPIVVKTMPLFTGLFWIPTVLSCIAISNYYPVVLGINHCLIMGCALYMYIKRFPERFTKTVKYGLSHSIMHIGLWASLLLHYNTISLLIK